MHKMLQYPHERFENSNTEVHKIFRNKYYRKNVLNNKTVTFDYKHNRHEKGALNKLKVNLLQSSNHDNKTPIAE